MDKRVLSLGKNITRAGLRFAGVCLYRAGLAQWIIRRSPRTRVVLYHAVEKVQSSFTKGLGTCVSPETFALHIAYYQRYYRVISMHDYLEKPQASTSHTALLITFDDGYASILENALPLLEAQHMPATVYLIGNAVRGRMVWVNRLNQAMNDYPGETREILSSYPGLVTLSRRGIIHRIQTTFTPAKIDTLIRQLEQTIPNLTSNNQKLFATPEDIRHMQNRGIEFGFHSNDHWNLNRCKDRELAATLATEDLGELINSHTFAYPFGYFCPAAIGQLKRLGYQKLMTVGSNNDRFSDLHLDRTEVFETSFTTLFARLEIEEPTISAMRRWIYRRKVAAKKFTTPQDNRTI